MMAEASLGRSEAFAVAGVVAICLPIDDLEDGEWNRKTVSSAAAPAQTTIDVR